MQKTVLHVGCGQANPEKLHRAFRGADWREVRLDIDPGCKPDIIATLQDMGPVESGSVDAVYSSHNVEHLYPHEVNTALREFLRVLKDDGVALITLPDLQQVAAYIAKGTLEDAIYDSPAGPISPLDILYGHRGSMAEGNLFMAHRTGFTAQTLANALKRAGFVHASVQRDGRLNLWAIGFKQLPPPERLNECYDSMFPHPVKPDSSK